MKNKEQETKKRKTRRIFAEIELDEDMMERNCEVNGNECDGDISYIEKEFGWLSDSGIYLKNAIISDEDDESAWGRYIGYLISWAFDHHGDLADTYEVKTFERWKREIDKCDLENDIFQLGELLYMNKQTGEILREQEMIEQFKNCYDGDDPTNTVGWEEYYSQFRYGVNSVGCDANGDKDFLLNLLIAQAESRGWNVTIDSDREGERYAEFSQYSPAGEDFWFSVSFKDEKDLVYKVMDYYEGFDVDEHAEVWINAKGNVLGIPSASVLVRDAEKIEDMVEELAYSLSSMLNVYMGSKK